MKRAVASVATGDKAAPAAQVRTAARSLLGRDSESLSEKNFTRILHDAHDADVVDLRKRGSDFEVAPAVAATAVDKQLAEAATANAPAPKVAAPVQRGMGSRGIGRGPMSKKGEMPANLLSVGVVGPRLGVVPASSPASAAPTNTAKPAADDEAVAVVEESLAEKPARATKKRAAKKAPRKEAAADAKPASKAGASPKRPRAARKKTAS